MKRPFFFDGSNLRRSGSEFESLLRLEKLSPAGLGLEITSHVPVFFWRLWVWCECKFAFSGGDGWGSSRYIEQRHNWRPPGSHKNQWYPGSPRYSRGLPFSSTGSGKRQSSSSTGRGERFDRVVKTGCPYVAFSRQIDQELHGTALASQRFERRLRSRTAVCDIAKASPRARNSMV